MARVAVAMSGGVDSSVAAALLVEQGHDVIGLTMNLWPEWLKEPEGPAQACCGVGAVEDARGVASVLGIRHYVLNMREAFERAVIDYFCEEYARGRTPNPCIACNQAVKFQVLLEKVGDLGCDALATGHYARVVRDDASGRFLLLRAVDPAKDQSYVLYALTQEHLSRVCFPVGHYRKEQIRQVARRCGLAVADKPDSQEICFVPNGHYAELVASRRPEAARPGPIVDRTGAVIGTHAGIGRYTVGQRRGLGLARSRPAYVVEIDPARNALVVGGPEELLRTSVTVGRVNWIVPPPLPSRVTVRVRHAGGDAAAVLHLRDGGMVDVVFETPQRAAAPGQAAAFFAGERVLGGGIIEDMKEMRGDEQPH